MLQRACVFVFNVLQCAFVSNMLQRVCVRNVIFICIIMRSLLQTVKHI